MGRQKKIAEIEMAAMCETKIKLLRLEVLSVTRLYQVRFPKDKTKGPKKTTCPIASANSEVLGIGLLLLSKSRCF